MVYKALPYRDIKLSYIKCYKCWNNNLSVILLSKQGGMLELVNPRYEDWVSIQLLALSVVTFLFTYPRCPVIFQCKQIKQKLGNPLGAWRNFCVDLTWRMGNICQFFLGFLQELSGFHILLGLSIFTKVPKGKFIHARHIQLTKNLRDSWNQTTSTHYGNRQRNIMI